MKRTLIFLFVCFLCLNLSACGSEPASTAAVNSFSEANFNNNYWFSGDFWALDDTIFYLQDGMYNMGAYRSTNGSQKLLFQESDFSEGNTTIGDIFVCDNFLYFELTEAQGTWLYRYNLEECSYAPVCQAPELYRWAVVDDYFIYREHPANNEDKNSPLWVYNMPEGTATQVCADVEEFGIVDGQLRYITNVDDYELYQYDYAENHSAFLGKFYCEFDDAYDIFNFIPDGVVMLNWTNAYDRNLVVYSTSSDSTAVYTLPKGIHNLVACDQYAYAVIYDTKKNSSTALPAEENGIYRINLSDGSYEVVEHNADDGTEIHVVSDDCIYIVQRKMNLMFQAERHVYKYDHAAGSKEKLTVI